VMTASSTSTPSPVATAPVTSVVPLASVTRATPAAFGPPPAVYSTLPPCLS
jgi:hypothetical protein